MVIGNLLKCVDNRVVVPKITWSAEPSSPTSTILKVHRPGKSRMGHIKHVVKTTIAILPFARRTHDGRFSRKALKSFDTCAIPENTNAIAKIIMYSILPL